MPPHHSGGANDANSSTTHEVATNEVANTTLVPRTTDNPAHIHLAQPGHPGHPGHLPTPPAAYLTHPTVHVHAPRNPTQEILTQIDKMLLGAATHCVGSDSRECAEVRSRLAMALSGGTGTQETHGHEKRASEESVYLPYMKALIGNTGKMVELMTPSTAATAFQWYMNVNQVLMTVSMILYIFAPDWFRTHILKWFGSAPVATVEKAKESTGKEAEILLAGGGVMNKIGAKKAGEVLNHKAEEKMDNLVAFNNAKIEGGIATVPSEFGHKSQGSRHSESSAGGQPESSGTRHSAVHRPGSTGSSHVGDSGETDTGSVKGSVNGSQNGEKKKEATRATKKGKEHAQ